MRILVASSAVVAVIVTAAPPASFGQARQEQASQNRFCMQINNEGQARCAYRTLAQCEHARPRGSAGRCFDRTYMLAATAAAPRAAAKRGKSTR